MKEKLPREFYWKDFAMDNLLQSPLFMELHKVFKQLAREPMLFVMDEEKILNEVGYEVTWLCFQDKSKVKENTEQFVRQVYANTGVKEHAEAVMSLVFGIVKVHDWTAYDIGKHMENELKRLNSESWCGHYVIDFIGRMDREGRIFDEIFVPYQERYEEYPDSYYEEIVNGSNKQSSRAAEPISEYNNKARTFTLEAIVDYAKERMTLEISQPLQLMLYTLLANDGTKEEIELVNSITPHILQRNPVSFNHPTFSGSMFEMNGPANITLSTQQKNE